jgi:restriction system protein
MVGFDEAGFWYSVPEELDGHIEVTQPYQILNAKGARTGFGIDLTLSELGMRRSLKTLDLTHLKYRVGEVLESWAKKYRRHTDAHHSQKSSADLDSMNTSARRAIDAVETLLSSRIGRREIFTWEQMIWTKSFRSNAKDLTGSDRWVPYVDFDSNGKPAAYEKLPLPEEVTIEDFNAGHGALKKLFKGKQLNLEFEQAHNEWKGAVDRTNKVNQKRKTTFQDLAWAYNELKEKYETFQTDYNASLDALRYNGLKGKAVAVGAYFDSVLDSAVYPDEFPLEWQLEFKPRGEILVVDYRLPSPDDLPRIESYSYDESTGTVDAKKLNRPKTWKLYSDAVYQLCLCTIHGIFSSDVDHLLKSIVFNGYVTITDHETGLEDTRVILSVSTDRNSFTSLDLADVDPKAAFESLEGVAAEDLHDLVPVTPVLPMNHVEKQFIDGKGTAE